MEPVGSFVNILAQSSDMFCKKGVDLLDSAAYDVIDFHKSIANAHWKEEYTYDYTQVMEKLNKKWKKKELAWLSIPTTFPDKIRPNENLIFEKGGSQ